MNARSAATAVVVCLAFSFGEQVGASAPAPPSAFPPPDARQLLEASGGQVPAMESSALSSTVSAEANAPAGATSTPLALPQYRRPWNACRIVLVGGCGGLGAIGGAGGGVILAAFFGFISSDSVTEEAIIGGAVIGGVIGLVSGVWAGERYARRWCD